MGNGITSSHWSQLRALRPQNEDALAVIPIFVDGNQTALSSAMDQAGLLHLLIPVAQGPAVTPPADLNGLKVRHRRLETGTVLDLSAPPSHEQVFTHIVIHNSELLRRHVKNLFTFKHLRMGL